MHLCGIEFVVESGYHQSGSLTLFIYTRKYMHAETPRLADKTIVFSEHEVFKVVVMVTR
jgi:hypothetical protein